MAESTSTHSAIVDTPTARGNRAGHLADFTVDPRLLILSGMSLVIGAGGAFAAWVLVKLIALATNVVWFASFTTVPAVMANAARTP